jgi:glutaconate CoA-transferase, subunit B
LSESAPPVFRGGPSAIITTLGILRSEPKTNEFVLDGWFPFSSVEEIKANTGWALRVAPDAREIPAPSATELANLRRVDETGALRKK